MWFLVEQARNSFDAAQRKLQDGTDSFRLVT